MNPLSIRIADTTREERERIVAESVGNTAGLCDGCSPGIIEMYNDYIEGKRELREINAEFHARYMSGSREPEDTGNPAAVCRREDFQNVECLTMRGLRGRADVPREQLFAAWTAGQLARWYAGNRFCGACGSPMKNGTTERSLVCPRCGRTVYPRINPAIIAAVTKGDEIVLTRYRGARSTFNALVAGFVEIGETLEDTVRREVMEETGLRVKNLRYYKSQPWGIADDLLAGFFCEVDGSTEIHMDAEELSLARWTRREDVVLQPDDASLTNEMMKLFRDGLEFKALP